MSERKNEVPDFTVGQVFSYPDDLSWYQEMKWRNNIRQVHITEEMYNSLLSMVERVTKVPDVTNKVLIIASISENLGIAVGIYRHDEYFYVVALLMT